MSWRKIQVLDRKYKWMTNGYTVVIQAPSKKKYQVYAADLVGMNVDEWERAQDKKYGSLTPKHIRKHILRELWKLDND